MPLRHSPGAAIERVQTKAAGQAVLERKTVWRDDECTAVQHLLFRVVGCSSIAAGFDSLKLLVPEPGELLLALTAMAVLAVARLGITGAQRTSASSR